MKVIISAAGTGGHINPAIAIANKIKEDLKKVFPEVEFIVSEYNTNPFNNL